MAAYLHGNYDMSVKITDLGPIVLPLVGTEQLEIVDVNGESRRVSSSDLSSNPALVATFLTLTPNADLPNERILTAGVGIAFIDGGAGNPLTINAVGAGQVDSVVSGANITIDATDPVNPIANLDAAIAGVSVNGVTLNAAGLATNFLNEAGVYVAASGGQVDSVVGGANVTVNAADPVNPVVNLDAALLGVSVNGVTLNAAGAAANYLDETGNYSVPAGGGGTLGPTLVVVGNVNGSPFNPDPITSRIHLESLNGNLFGRIGYTADSDLIINSLAEDASIQMLVTGGGSSDLLVLDASGQGTALYHSGSSQFRLRTTGTGVAVRDNSGNNPATGGSQGTLIGLLNVNGLLVSQLGFDLFGPNLRFTNRVHGGRVDLLSETTAGVLVNLLQADPDAGVESFFGNVGVSRTIDAVAGGLEVNNLLTGAGFERVLTLADLIGTQTGTFVGTLTGFAANPTGTINFSISGNLCTLYNNGALIQAISNSTFMTMTGLPAAVQPAVNSTVPCMSLRDNGINGFQGGASVTGGVVTFIIGDPAGSGFTAFNGKGIVAGWSITYPIA